MPKAVTRYETDDGRTFKTEQEAKEWETCGRTKEKLADLLHRHALNPSLAYSGYEAARRCAAVLVTVYGAVAFLDHGHPSNGT